MKYKFLCPECGRRAEVQMPISEYRPDGHLCSCGAEMIRDPQDFCRNYRADCSGFYAEHQSG